MLGIIALQYPELHTLFNSIDVTHRRRILNQTSQSLERRHIVASGLTFHIPLLFKNKKPQPYYLLNFQGLNLTHVSGLKKKVHPSYFKCLFAWSTTKQQTP